jgi:hypothetical protein
MRGRLWLVLLIGTIILFQLELTMGDASQASSDTSPPQRPEPSHRPPAELEQEPAPATRSSELDNSLSVDLEEPASMLENAARRRYPNDFAGVWIDGEDIVVAFTSQAGARTSTLRNEIQTDTAGVQIRAHTASTTLVDLERATDRLNSAYKEAITNKSTGSPLLELTSWGPDVPGNRLTVSLRSSDDDVSRRLRDLIIKIVGVGIPVEIVGGVNVKPVVCTRIDCTDHKSRGGLELYNWPTTASCTSGFTAVRSGVQGDLTSGHCFRDQEDVAHGPYWWGSAGKSYFYTGSLADVVFVSRFSAVNPIERWVYRTEADKAYTISQVGAGGSVGSQVCFAGVGTYGEGCLTVAYTGQTISYPAPWNVTLIDQHIASGNCPDPGDSGSPVYQKPSSGGRAQGILSGTTLDDTGCYEPRAMIYSPIDNAQDLTAASVKIYN